MANLVPDATHHLGEEPAVSQRPVRNSQTGTGGRDKPSHENQGKRTDRNNDCKSMQPETGIHAVTGMNGTTDEHR